MSKSILKGTGTGTKKKKSVSIFHETVAHESDSDENDFTQKNEESSPETFEHIESAKLKFTESTVQLMTPTQVEQNIEKVIKLFQTASSLNLPGCTWIDDWFFWTLHARGIIFRHLLHINIRACNSVTDSSLKIIGKIAPNLISIILDGCREVTEFGLNFLAENCTDLEKVSLVGCNVNRSICTWTEKAVASYRGTPIEKLPGLPTANSCAPLKIALLYSNEAGRTVPSFLSKIMPQRKFDYNGIFGHSRITHSDRTINFFCCRSSFHQLCGPYDIIMVDSSSYFDEETCIAEVMEFKSEYPGAIIVILWKEDPDLVNILQKLKNPPLGGHRSKIQMEFDKLENIIKDWKFNNDSTTKEKLKGKPLSRLEKLLRIRRQELQFDIENNKVLTENIHKTEWNHWESALWKNIIGTHDLKSLKMIEHISTDDLNIFINSKNTSKAHRIFHYDHIKGKGHPLGHLDEAATKVLLEAASRTGMILKFQDWIIWDISAFESVLNSLCSVKNNFPDTDSHTSVIPWLTDQDCFVFPIIYAERLLGEFIPDYADRVSFIDTLIRHGPFIRIEQPWLNDPCPKPAVIVYPKLSAPPSQKPTLDGKKGPPKILMRRTTQALFEFRLTESQITTIFFHLANLSVVSSLDKATLKGSIGSCEFTVGIKGTILNLELKALNIFDQPFLKTLYSRDDWRHKKFNENIQRNFEETFQLLCTTINYVAFKLNLLSKGIPLIKEWHGTGYFTCSHSKMTESENGVEQLNRERTHRWIHDPCPLCHSPPKTEPWYTCEKCHICSSCCQILKEIATSLTENEKQHICESCKHHGRYKTEDYYSGRHDIFSAVIVLATSELRPFGYIFPFRNQESSGGSSIVRQAMEIRPSHDFHILQGVDHHNIVIKMADFDPVNVTLEDAEKLSLSIIILFNGVGSCASIETMSSRILPNILLAARGSIVEVFNDEKWSKGTIVRFTKEGKVKISLENQENYPESRQAESDRATITVNWNSVRHLGFEEFSFNPQYYHVKRHNWMDYISRKDLMPPLPFEFFYFRKEEIFPNIFQDHILSPRESSTWGRLQKFEFSTPTHSSIATVLDYSNGIVRFIVHQSVSSQMYRDLEIGTYFNFNKVNN